MKSLFYALAVIALLIFIVNSVQLISSWSDGFYSITDTGSLAGWEDTGTSNVDYQALSKRFTQQILNSKREANQFKQYSLILSFVVTALAGLSTLISTLYASKNQDQTPIRAIRLVACFTFLTTLVTWSYTQVNDYKNTVEQNLQKVRDLQQEFAVLYRKSEQSERDDLIASYSRKLESYEKI